MTGTKGNGPPWGVKGQGGAYGIPGVYTALDRSGPLMELMRIDGASGIWKCDEAAGSTITDYSLNSRNMTITGAPSAYRTAIGGKTGVGMSWPTSTTDIAATAYAAVDATNFTMEILTWFSANPGFAANLLSCDNGSVGSFLQLLTSGQARFQITNSGGTFITTAAALATNTLHHIVGVATGGTFKLRVNGVSPATNTKTPANNGKAIKIHSGFGSSSGPMTVAMAAYYDGIALSDAQIDAHFAQI